MSHQRDIRGGGALDLSQSVLHGLQLIVGDAPELSSSPVNLGLQRHDGVSVTVHSGRFLFLLGLEEELLSGRRI